MELLLPLRFPSIERLLGHAHRDLLLACSQAIIRFLRELIERHPDLTAVLDVRLMLFIVKFRYGRSICCCSSFAVTVRLLTLDRGWVQLHHLHFGFLQLLPQAKNEVVQRGLAGAVVGASQHRHQGQAGRCADKLCISAGLLTRDHLKAHTRSRPTPLSCPARMVGSLW